MNLYKSLGSKSQDSGPFKRGESQGMEIPGICPRNSLALSWPKPMLFPASWRGKAIRFTDLGAMARPSIQSGEWRRCGWHQAFLVGMTPGTKCSRSPLVHPPGAAFPLIQLSNTLVSKLFLGLPWVYHKLSGSGTKEQAVRDGVSCIISFVSRNFYKNQEERLPATSALDS